MGSPKANELKITDSIKKLKRKRSSPLNPSTSLWTGSLSVAFQWHVCNLMGLSFLEYRLYKSSFQKDCFFCGVWKPLELALCDFSLLQNNLTLPTFFCRSILDQERQSCDGLRCPKIAMITRFLSLQHLHFLSNVFGFISRMCFF